MDEDIYITLHKIDTQFQAYYSDSPIRFILAVGSTTDGLDSLDGSTDGKKMTVIVM